MNIPLFQVDAFTDQPFKGNCPMEIKPAQPDAEIQNGTCLPHDVRAYNRAAWNSEVEKKSPWTVPVSVLTGFFEDRYGADDVLSDYMGARDGH